MQIEKGIPAPLGANGKVKATAEKMEIGDSVLVLADGKVTATARATSFRAAFYNLKRKCVIRKDGDGIRVWRVA